MILAYFAIAGIFFPRYRVYIKEGWRCFIDKIRNKECSVSFDNRMRLALSMWLTRRGMPSLGRFFYNKRNFNITLIVIGVVSTIVSIYLFILLINYLIYPSCVDNVCPI